ncbi:MAG: hypothetical protein LBI99_06345 [Propionibacteriaceae bacterium]|jgi:hypothetical protein|nr:hypothetical protein [Propionibacteriaceae bacterium]
MAKRQLKGGAAISVPGLAASAVFVLLVFSVIPSWWASDSRDDPFPAAAYAEMWMGNPIILLFQLAVVVPYALRFGIFLRNRFITYTRVRCSLRRYLGRHFAVNAVIAFIIFFAVGIIPNLWVVFGGFSFNPGAYFLLTPQEIAQAEAAWTTFSQFTVYGPWAFPVVFSLWLGVNAVLYSSITLCLIMLMKNQIIPLVLPWLASLVLSFGFAVFGLEAFSPGLLFPFNLTQLPMENLLYPLGLVATAAAVLVAYVLYNAPKLHNFQ